MKFYFYNEYILRALFGRSSLPNLIKNYNVKKMFLSHLNIQSQPEITEKFYFVYD